MDDKLDQFRIITESHIPEVELIKEAFAQKKVLEKAIQDLIKEYEDKYGLAIDMIRYQRDITLPVKGPRYTSLSIIISPEV